MHTFCRPALLEYMHHTDRADHGRCTAPSLLVQAVAMIHGKLTPVVLLQAVYNNDLSVIMIHAWMRRYLVKCSYNNASKYINLVAIM
ncbi:hypothetical protein BDA96_09G034600 [Sorghum bicolor]|uniref:Uncharacterized protein n=1 Tax=Sorghum bicolor TaxID=4558 RepID=A0A921Q9G4_SORBI|nr:hypothetical protein BDA96_09G034600 [Sorghum bicolor]